MAGFYPDVPAPRMAFDRDGSIGFNTDGSTYVNQLTSAQLVNLNNEAAGGSFPTNRNGILFPEPRDILGINFFQGTATYTWYPETSVDTTNGADGNWVSQGTFVNAGHYPTQRGDLARTNIKPVSWLGVKAVRCRAASVGGDTRCGLHLYGTTTNFSGLNTLRMWHPTLDEPLDDNTSADGAHLDWGDATRGTSADKTFRIKNNSLTLTANTITISSEVLTNASPTLESQILYDYNGSGFAPTATIASLAPGAISALVTVRKTTDINAALFLWWLRTVVEAGSWS